MNYTLIIALVIGGYLYLKARAVTNLTYRVGGIEGLSLFRSQIQFKLNVIVFNPSNTSITVDYAQVNLALQNSYIGKCILQQKQVIKALSEDTVQIFVSIGLLDLVQAIPDILGSVKSRLLNFRVTGIVGGEGVKANIDIPISITIPKVQKTFKKVTLTANEKYEFVKGSEVKVITNKQQYKLVA
ncbi:MAG: LEA type 2 family protein [Flavobacterium sp.]|jgi:LEA14-like dessication related protein|nr:LEA type 2 family protein [Flavobacterium sp.]MCU0470233.1 LEA type 2 family protein [Arcicella sp.]